MRVLSKIRPVHVAGAAALMVALVLALAVGPVVRGAVSAEARRRNVSIEIGAVEVGWFRVSLANTVVRPVGWGGAEVRLDTVRVLLSSSLRPIAVEASGGRITITGALAEVADGVRRWRSSFGQSGGPAGFQSVPVAVDGLSLTWVGAGEQIAEASGVAARRDGSGLSVQASAVRCHLGGRVASASDAKVHFTQRWSLLGAEASSLSIASDASSPPAGTHPDREESEPVVPDTEEAGKPILSLPDVHRFRAASSALAAVASERVEPGAELRVDALTLEFDGGPARGPLTLGPGALSLHRSPASLDLRFVMGGAKQRVPVAISALLPMGEGDVSLQLQGGPIPLSSLGIREGQWGVVEVQQATVAGSMSLSLAADGSALTLDASGSVRRLAIQQEHLAPDIVQGLDLSLRARGVLSSAGLRLDDFAAGMGAIQLSASGVLDQEADHVAGTIEATLAPAPCQSVLDSIPTSLLPAIQGTKVEGTIGADGRLSFDTRKLDDLRLEYDIRNACHPTAVPEALSRDHFRQPFLHRVYLPDGTMADRQTGPGTKDWTALDAISPYMQVAVLTTEDGAFPKHQGFNRAAIRSSLIANLKARRFVRGASTISMQLAKNLFLSREKTLSRKLEEVLLTAYLEQAFSKDELMELYLNVIEFGPDVYGVGPAAEYYFGRSPAELNFAECLFLASLLPSPLRYSRMRDAAQVPDGWMKSLRATMRIANKRGLLSDAELAEAEAEDVLFWHGGQRPETRPPARAQARPGRDDAGDDVEPPPLVP